MAIRIPVTLVIEMDDEQEARYRKSAKLPEPSRAKDVAGAVRGEIHNLVRRYMSDWADVSIKGR